MILLITVFYLRAFTGARRAFACRRKGLAVNAPCVAHYFYSVSGCSLRKVWGVFLFVSFAALWASS
jgi:hypothetical protein